MFKIYFSKEEVMIDVGSRRLRVRWIDAEDGRTFKPWVAWVKRYGR